MITNRAFLNHAVLAECNSNIHQYFLPESYVAYYDGIRLLHDFRVFVNSKQLKITRAGNDSYHLNLDDPIDSKLKLF